MSKSRILLRGSDPKFIEVHMKARLLALCVVLTSAQVLCAQTSGKPSYQELFDAVWSTINVNFYDPSFGGVDWKAVREKYAPEVAKVKDDRAFLDLAYKMMDELHVSHLGLRPSQVRRVNIGVRTWRLDGKSVITNVAFASDAQKQGLRVGDLLLDQPGDVTGMIGTSTQIHVQGCDGRERTVEVRRENPWWPPEHPSLRWKTIEQASGRRLGYIKTTRFDDDAAPLIDTAMDALKDTYGLIIDLRDNSGGNISSMRLASYFVPPPQLGVVLLSRPFLNKLGNAPEQIDLSKIPRVSGVYTTRGIIDTMKKNDGGAAFYGEDLGERRYRGRVIVLINRDTGSAAEGFAWMLKNRPSITLVGRTTAGALLGGEPFDLPGGWVLTVPTHASWGPDGKRYVDQPVAPDVEVKWTRQDFCDQRDPDVAKALDLLSSAKP